MFSILHSLLHAVTVFDKLHKHFDFTMLHSISPIFFLLSNFLTT